MPACPRLRALVLVAVAALATASCAGGARHGADPAPAKGAALIDPGDGGNYHPKLDPAGFVAVIDNPYLPLEPGSSWVYEGTVDNQRQRIEVVVRPERKKIMGIQATVVRDTVFGADGKPTEVTTDWFAQDASGNVWYLGEDSKDVENGKVTSTKGSWLAGVHGARPGITMLAAPIQGKAYRQEFFPGEAEDMAKVVSLGASARVAAGSYDKLVATREWTPLEPKNVEDKFYAPGVGNVLVELTSGEHGRMELTRFTPGRG